MCDPAPFNIHNILPFAVMQAIFHVVFFLYLLSPPPTQPSLFLNSYQSWGGGARGDERDSPSQLAIAAMQAIFHVVFFL